MTFGAWLFITICLFPVIWAIILFVGALLVPQKILDIGWFGVKIAEIKYNKIKTIAHNKLTSIEHTLDRINK